MIPSIDQTMCRRLIERLKSLGALNCHIFERPFDPQYAANDIIMSAMGNNGVVWCAPGTRQNTRTGTDKRKRRRCGVSISSSPPFITTRPCSRRHA